MHRITKDQLARYLFRQEFETITTRASPVDFEVEVSYKKVDNTVIQPLYKFQALYSKLEPLAPNGYKDDLIEVFDRSGMYELEVEFNPASADRIDIKDGKIKLQNGTNILSKIRTSDSTFKAWLQQACSLLGDKVHLIPDTNVIMRLYYTNYLRNLLIEKTHMFEDYGRTMSITIPRLGILEIESMYNRNKESENPPPCKAKQSDKDLYEQNEERKGKKRRRAFQSMGEILSLKNDGATVLPATDMSLIQSFTPVAGQGKADAWIRREISNSKPNLVRSTQVRQDRVETSNMAFLTCDLMNSLAAIAEDLNTIYFYRLEDTNFTLTGIAGYEKLSQLIFNTAIHFEECNITLRGNGKERQHNCKGAWSGKSVYDWQNNIVDVTTISSKG